jgi:hypothetical protein
VHIPFWIETGLRAWISEASAIWDASNGSGMPSTIQSASIPGNPTTPDAFGWRKPQDLWPTRWYCINGPTRQILCHVSWHVKQMLQSMLTLPGALRCYWVSNRIREKSASGSTPF